MAIVRLQSTPESIRASHDSGCAILQVGTLANHQWYPAWKVNGLFPMYVGDGIRRSHEVAPSEDDKSAKLKVLKNLLDDGLIDDEDFRFKKGEVLGTPYEVEDAPPPRSIQVDRAPVVSTAFVPPIFPSREHDPKIPAWPKVITIGTFLAFPVLALAVGFIARSLHGGTPLAIGLTEIRDLNIGYYNAVFVLLSPFTALLLTLLYRAAFAIIKIVGPTFIAVYITMLFAMLIELWFIISMDAGFFLALNGDAEAAFVIIGLLRVMASMMSAIGLLAWRHKLSAGESVASSLVAVLFGVVVAVVVFVGMGVGIYVYSAVLSRSL